MFMLCLDIEKESELRCGYDLRAYVPETERSEKSRACGNSEQKRESRDLID
jgi:hypothetical protein